ncbi:substance-K receptor-like [Montipora foliosa]|uniref:substance-K receptor-like n=1 Tax=Montipora foliosa TaxID=591990 RepID=UPI0035F159F5
MNNSSETLNVTYNFLPECSQEMWSPALEWVKKLVYLILVFFAIFGNALVIRIVFTHRRMKSTTNYLIVNMAVSDLFMAIFNMIPTAVSMLRGKHSWLTDGPFGQISCKMLNFSQGTSMACSIITLTTSAFDRYFAIVFPLWKVATVGKIRWLVTLIWIASFAFASPMLYAAKVQLFYGVPFCIENWSPAFDHNKAAAIYTIVSFVLLYALPLSVIFILYSKIIVTVWGRHIPGNTTPANVQLLDKSKKNVLKMLVTVVVAFGLCWFLIHINLLLQDFTDIFPASCGIPVELQTTGFLFAHANSAINCCIYVVFSQDFRHGFKEILRPLFPLRSEPSLLRRTRSRGTMETRRSTKRDKMQPAALKPFGETVI